jgi:uncharacterized membrane protein
MAFGKGVRNATPNLPEDGIADPDSALPHHVHETIDALAAVRAAHDSDSTLAERALARLSAITAKPRFVGLLSVIIIGWLGVNLAARRLGWPQFDAPPFSAMAAAASVGSLYLAALIITTQRRDDKLARHRDELTLQLVILSDQKSAKIIQLLEEMRRDNPLVPDRVDTAALDMATPADTRGVLNAIKKVHGEAPSASVAPKRSRPPS